MTEPRSFTLPEAREELVRVRETTAAFVGRLASARSEEDARAILAEWAASIEALGAVVKGPWLVDFDSGAGYYCWKWPEESLEFFHGYDEGFAGRMPLQ